MKEEGKRGFLSLGSNLGDREDNLERVLAALRAAPGIEVRRVSRTYETGPVGKTDQPDFLNLVVEIETTLSPRELLAAVKKIEKTMGRAAGERWGPRLIDIDILLLGEERIEEADLRLPHPEMLKRAFVMIPLAELEPALLLANERADCIAAKLAKEQKVNPHPLD